MVYAIAKFLMRLTGWQTYGEAPPVPKSVVIGAPHTSNMDAIYMVLAAILLRCNLKWLVKDSLYNTPLKPILKWAGAIPITRTGSQNVVEQVAAIIRDADNIHIALAPEGTRKRTEGWKSGFYYIAVRAKVPLYFGFVDYAKKQVGIGGHMEPTGDLEADMAQIRAFYETKTARFPENYGPIKLLARKAGKSTAEPQPEA
ncbi:MAG: lysophospholipid acyltransferase family protein [Chloroflexota bacterium]|nr:lysophospholipid acyltransferase family protein [Chloroflexota bacterium]